MKLTNSLKTSGYSTTLLNAQRIEDELARGGIRYDDGRVNLYKYSVQT